MKLVFLVIFYLTIGFAAEYAYKRDVFRLADSDFSSDSKEGDVLLLTDSTFSSAIKEFDYIYCLFEGPQGDWCGYTQASFHSIAQELSRLTPNLKFAEIDCRVEKTTCTMYDISGGNEGKQRTFTRI